MTPELEAKSATPPPFAETAGQATPLPERGPQSPEGGTETPEKEFDPAAELANLQGAIERNAEAIQNLTGVAEGTKTKLAELQKELGVSDGAPGEKTADERNLELLLKEKERLEKEREEAEAANDLNTVLEKMGKLPPAELTIIIQTGKGPDEKPITGPRGEVNPDVAKQLAQLAQRGAKKITKAVLGIVFGIVKGIASGAVETLKKAA